MESQGMMATLGDAGPSPTVSHGGVTWTVGHPTQRAKADLEMLVVEAARKNLDDLKPVTPAEEWERDKATLSGLLRARAWQTFGQLWSEVCNGPQADAIFLCSLMRPHHKDVTIEQAERLWLESNDDCRVALMMVMPDFFDQLSANLPAGAEEKKRRAAVMRADYLARLAQGTLTG